MKKTSTCPKCESTNIFIREAKRGEYRGLAIGWSVLGLHTPEIYICRDCGYLEEYLTEKQLSKLPNK